MRNIEESLRLEFPDFLRFWDLGASSQRSYGNISQAARSVLSPLLPTHSAGDESSQGQHTKSELRAIHELTGVHELHKRGIVGHGASVAVIDVGLDYLHPVFAATSDRSSPLRYTTDFVGDDFVPGANLPQPDSDTYTECEIHGTHTSALIVGRQQSVGFVGVAPGAALDHYRVAGCLEVNRFDDEILIEALLLAHSRRVDVISLSLANGYGPYPSELVSDIIRRIVQEGQTLCVVSAGNTGWAGPFSAVSPAAAAGAVSAGAVHSIHVIRSNPMAQATYWVAGEQRSFMFEWQPSFPSRFPQSLRLYVLSLNASIPNDACGDHAADLGLPDDLEGHIVLIRRGGCAFQQKIDNVLSHGAAYVLIYDNTPTDGWDIFLYDNTFHGIRGCGSLLAETGLKLANIFAEADNVILEMDSNFTLLPKIRTRYNPLYPAGSLYTGGSWGPTGDLSTFPSILGPGGSVWSAVPRSAGGFGTYTGTSISAPYIAGCIALLRSVYPDWAAPDIVRALIHTATPLPFSDGNKSYDNLLAPVWQQGGGLVNMVAALESRTAISVSFLNFNDTEFYRVATFTITNLGDRSASYELQYVPAATVDTLDSRRHIIAFAEDPASSDQATAQFLAHTRSGDQALVDLTPSSLHLPSGGSAVIHAEVNLANVADEKTCPLYSGYIKINSSHDGVLSLPCGGIGCRIGDVSTLPPNWNLTFLAAARYIDSDNPNSIIQPAAANTTFRLPASGNPGFDLSSEVMYPMINIQVAMISPHAVAFLETCSSVSTSANANSTLSVPVDLHGTQIAGGFSRIVPRRLLWAGKLTNGSLAISGSYCLQICTSRTLGSVLDCTKTVQFNLIYF